MRAYDESYVSDVQTRMGSMLDVAVNQCGASLDEFYRMFLASRYASCLSAGEPTAFVGRSGSEIAIDVLGLEGLAQVNAMVQPAEEYWAGWALGFFQWASGKDLQSINACVPIAEVLRMYSPYHEMDVLHFCERMDELCAGAAGAAVSNLRQAREAAGLSQSQLAQLSGVPLRTLQQYEQRQKNIDKARAEYLLALATALHVAPEKLLERRLETRIEYSFLNPRS